MGRLFFEHLGGRIFYVCAKCDLYLTKYEELVSNDFQGQTGWASCFKRVENILYDPKMEWREFLTGSYMVRMVGCKRCRTYLGWMYEFAENQTQSWKEGKLILERALIKTMQGFEEKKCDDDEEEGDKKPSDASVPLSPAP